MVGRVRRKTVLLIGVALALACRSKSNDATNPHMWHEPGVPIVIEQPNPSVVVGIDVRTGEVRWRHWLEYEQRRPYGVEPMPKLSCGAILTPAGNVVLSYEHELHVLSARTGELQWTETNRGYQFCPAVGPDSSLLRISRQRTCLVKLSASGDRLWTYDFPEAGVAVTGPLALYPSGDVLIRTDHRLLSVNPKGEPNWDVPLETEAE